MRTVNKSSAGRRVATLALLFALGVGLVPGEATRAQHNQSAGEAPRQAGAKVSPDLREQIQNARSQDDTTRVILQLRAAAGAQLQAALGGGRVRVKGHFGQLNSYALDVPFDAVEQLASFDEVDSVSHDRELHASGHVTNTTGAANVRTLPALKGGGSMAVDGTGVGIAVLDSGIYAEHLALKDAGGGSRTVFAKDFTGENTTADIYGHGTHVASTAAGNDKLSGQSGSFAGVAPNATLVSLRVLNSRGVGTVSNVLGALDWVLANGSRYKVKVVNLSLGTPAVDSYRFDPLCQAVRRLVDAGYVVVAAAGNDGRTKSNRYDSNNEKTYGLIHSPGNEPSAITVGASNSFGTDARHDDTIATYSSRGPTRAFWTDANGASHFDNLVKPDLVAPGNKVIYAQALNNHLVTTYPEIHAFSNDSSGGDNKRVMYMSGTSVSAPVVAGAAALLLQVNPSLTPNMVKMILMYTAQPLAGFNMFEQGAGQLNVDGAVRLAQRVRTDISARTRVGDPLLTTAAPSPTTTIAGTSFVWSQGVVMHHGFVTGQSLITKFQKVYFKGYLLGDGITEGYDTQSVNTSVMSSGILMTDGILMADGTTTGTNSPWLNDPVFWSNGILMGDGILMTDGILMGDGELLSDGILMTDGILMGDRTAQTNSVLASGESTACMK